MQSCNLHGLFLGPLVSGWLHSQGGFLWIVHRFTRGFQLGCEWKLCLTDSDTGSSWENFLHSQNALFLLIHSSPSLAFQKTKIKHLWIPEQGAKIDSKRILHFCCNLAILDLSLEILCAVHYVLIRLALICSSSKLGRISTVGMCLLSEWNLLYFRKSANCRFSFVLILKTMPALLNLCVFSSAKPRPCRHQLKRVCCVFSLWVPHQKNMMFLWNQPVFMQMKWFLLKMSFLSQECASAFCL